MFHRLTTPGYFGGLPAGYDLINAGNALADGAKVGDPNEGTYFLGFGEDATSLHFNRGLKALSQNTDALDDTLHRDLVVMHRTADVTAASPVSNITLPAGTYLGPVGMTSTGRSLSLLFSLRDGNDRPIRDTLGFNELNVASLTLTGGDAIGGGFSTNTVRLNFSPQIPTGNVYRVYYGVRQNAASLETQALLSERSFAMIYGHQTTTARAHLASAIRCLGSGTWADGTQNLSGDVEAALDKIITDLTAVAGAARIGAAATTGTPHALANGTIKSQLDALLGYINVVHNYLNGTTVGAEIIGGFFGSPTLAGADLIGMTTGEDMALYGSFEASSANIATGQFTIGGDGTTAIHAPVHLFSTLVVDDDVTLNNVTTINSGNLVLTSATFSANSSTFGLSNTPIVLTNSSVKLIGSSRISQRRVSLPDTAAVTISVNSADVYQIPDLSQNMTITINADSDVENAWFRITTAHAITGTFAVTVKDHFGNTLATLKSLAASGSHFTWVDLAYGVHPVTSMLAWLIEANYWKA